MRGGPFYESAIRGLRAGRVNMDFPITLGVVLTLDHVGGRDGVRSASTPISIAR